MSIHERLENLDFEIPTFHRERIDSAAQILQEKKLYGARLPAEFTRIWDENPIIVADYHHALLDPLPYVVIGDLLLARTLRRCEFIEKRVFPLLFEPHPVGIGSVEMIVPGYGKVDKTKLLAVTPNIPTWEMFTDRMFDKYFYFFQDKYHHWQEFSENLLGRVERSDLPNKYKVKGKCGENLGRLKKIYDEATNKWLNKGTLNDLTTEISSRLTKEIFGIDKISHLPDLESYRNSKFAGQLWLTIDLFKRFGIWEKILDILFSESKGEQFLFVGGSGDHRLWVDFSLKKGFSLKQARVDEKIDRPKGERLDFDALMHFLRERTLVPTNLIISVILAYVSMDLPVVRDGNDYGKKGRAARCWDGETYHQLFADNQDGWSPVTFGRKNFVGDTEPSMASLFVWNPGGDYYQQALRESLASGQPIRIDLEDLAERF